MRLNWLIGGAPLESFPLEVTKMTWLEVRSCCCTCDELMGLLLSGAGIEIVWIEDSEP